MGDGEHASTLAASCREEAYSSSHPATLVFVVIVSSPRSFLVVSWSSSPMYLRGGVHRPGPETFCFSDYCTEASLLGTFVGSYFSLVVLFRSGYPDHLKLE
ncbi:hypothetical protein IGI04_019715 [Brassica rapa subsp. trilocularis]|uniref:CASP-like protein n=1 Tax=Brassica rapa subsp. trilocularis TaxID=1813537 RepID=A0ABQ7MJ16_BRACM|nr:hypothetical protein IGI04_019715 [Brassica rapa subsp. trilocularis]